MSRLPRSATAAAAVSLLLGGCAAPAPVAPPAATPDTLSGTITVFAASSLTESFGTIADAFMAEHPAVDVVLSFAGSSGSAAQIVAGAPADVFASASDATMLTVTQPGFAEGEAVTFATNTLEIAVPPGNPGAVTGLRDLTDPDRAIAICAVEVPCGEAAQAVFEAAGLVASPDTLEQDVRAVLTKVELGEVDAGLVYRTDVLAAGADVEGIEFSEAAAAVGAYQIVPLSESNNSATASAFVAYVLSPAGQSVLMDAGFDAP